MDTTEVLKKLGMNNRGIMNFVGKTFSFLPDDNKDSAIAGTITGVHTTKTEIVFSISECYFSITSPGAKACNIYWDYEKSQWKISVYNEGKFHRSMEGKLKIDW